MSKVVPPKPYFNQVKAETDSSYSRAYPFDGKVVVSIPPNADLRKELEQAFEKRYPGIALEMVKFSSPPSFSRRVGSPPFFERLPRS